MAKHIKKISKSSGLPPGTLFYTGEKKTENIKITLINYNEAQYEEKEIKKIEECFPLKDKSSTTWINIDGIHQVKIVEEIGKHLNLHPLLLEDILDTNQRPKMEDHEDHIFIILKILCYNKQENKFDSEQISLILGSNFLVSFQEKEGDIFNSIRERIRTGKGKIRKMQADYLAYALIDAIVDNYFVVLEQLGERIENIEERLIIDPGPKTSQAIHKLKKDMIFLRKSAWPLREVINSLAREESSIIQESTDIYLRDVYDHIIRIIDTIETHRDILSGMFDIYLSSVSNRMNEIMKVLTIIATIFIPLTFIAGIYGMNFKYMPELELRWGYFTALLVMITISASMILYFRRRKWL